MQQFALASISPRSIAWLIRPGEWERLEEIIIYNCSTVGGFFNILIPLTEQDNLTPEYERFLAEYDPDFVVLAPDMTPPDFGLVSSQPYPFAAMPWEAVPQILNKRIDGSGMGDVPTMSPPQPLSIVTEEDPRWQNSLIAIADRAYLDASRLALIACGDVDPHLGQYRPVDASDEPEHVLEASGYREYLLQRILRAGRHPAEIAVQDRKVAINVVQRIEAPDRYQLTSIIKEQNTFPLQDPVERLRRCYESQRFPLTRPTFINLTAIYKRQQTYSKRDMWNVPNLLPRMVLIIGDEFTIQDAALFWNLRASEVYVAWLSFAEVETSLDELARWLESGHVHIYSSLGTRTGIHFTSSAGDFERLEYLVAELSRKRKKEHPTQHTIRQRELILYDYERRPLHQERVIVAQSASVCSFPVRVPADFSSGYYDLILDWTQLRLPRHKEVVNKLVSDEIIRGGYYRVDKDPGQSPDWKQERIQQFRVDRAHLLNIQVKEDSFIEFKKPSTSQIFNLLFVAAGYTRLEQSSAARYHMNFVARAGDLQTTARLLAGEPYQHLLEVLADNADKSKSGWLIDQPAKRRALHHYHLREVLNSPTPPETKRYFDTVSDELPGVAVELLQKELLERGFLLNCVSCSYRAWYPAEHIGQIFECTRCFQAQVYTTNPLWLYKLPEVVFQGFADNMQVPLLALDYLRRKSKYHFEWVADSDVYWTENSKERSRNVDLLCMSDGKLYIGEAKSNDAIEEAQFSLYRALSERLAVDGLVFATQQTQWNRGTTDRINQLRANFKGEIVVLTSNELYQPQLATTI